MKDLTGKIINDILVLCLTENPYRETRPRRFVPKSEKSRHCKAEYTIRSDKIQDKQCTCEGENHENLRNK